ncbi:MAG: hypothetical protein NZ920_01745 [Aigarchaeota archaeon]|nr:hypothetical protein [Aigarchaeota archaeon]MDW8093166.1 hypothetical protein [Nitrososphaerota archaeon]
MYRLQLNMMDNLNTTITLDPLLFRDYLEETEDALNELSDLSRDEEIEGQGLLESIEVIPVKVGERKEVVACDASVIQVAEYPRGHVLAMRGAVVKRSGDEVSATLMGPFLKVVRFTSLQRSAGLEEVKREVLAAFEQRVRAFAVSAVRGGITLFDASLSQPYDDPNAFEWSSLLRTAAMNNNVVMSFSKESDLIIDGWSLRSIGTALRPPVVVRLPVSLLHSSSFRFWGDVYVSRLSAKLFPFRVDVYPVGACVDESFSSLLASDALIYGYPETLALAHALCTFRWSEVVSIQRVLSERLRTTVTESLNPRSVIFSPFEGRET